MTWESRLNKEKYKTCSELVSVAVKWEFWKKLEYKYEKEVRAFPGTLFYPWYLPCPRTLILQLPKLLQTERNTIFTSPLFLVKQWYNLNLETSLKMQNVKIPFCFCCCCCFLYGFLYFLYFQGSNYVIARLFLCLVVIPAQVQSSVQSSTAASGVEAGGRLWNLNQSLLQFAVALILIFLWAQFSIEDETTRSKSIFNKLT